MLGNRRTDTGPQIKLRSALHGAGLRFRKDYAIRLSDSTIRPDIVFTRARVAVFLDGCFWHSCPEHATTPKRNADFWAQKLTRNLQRDREQSLALVAAGWTVVRVWEHVATDEAAQDVAEVVVRARSGIGAGSQPTGLPRTANQRRPQAGEAAKSPP